MGLGSLSIGRLDGPGSVRPRIAEQPVRAVGRERQGQNVEKNDSTKGVSRGYDKTSYKSVTGERGSLTLTTDEGDKVTISFANEQSTRVKQFSGYGPNGSFEKTRVKTTDSSSLSVSLEGNLSEEELKDIQDLVSRLSNGITAARGGDLEAAQAAFQGDGDLGSLANYTFDYQQYSDQKFRSKSVDVTA